MTHVFTYMIHDDDMMINHTCMVILGYQNRPETGRQWAKPTGNGKNTKELHNPNAVVSALSALWAPDIRWTLPR